MRERLPEQYRIHRGYHGSPPGWPYGGAFAFPKSAGRATLRCIASTGTNPADPPEVRGWEHVSVSSPKAHRCPNWHEMSFIKRQFWRPEEAVMQLHPPEAEYVNNHPHVLHLWRPLDGAIPLPPSILVGLPGLSPEAFGREGER